LTHGLSINKEKTEFGIFISYQLLQQRALLYEILLLDQVLQIINKLTAQTTSEKNLYCVLKEFQLKRIEKPVT